MVSVERRDQTGEGRSFSFENITLVNRGDEDDLYEALDDLCARQDKIEKLLWRNYLTRCGTPPALFLYDVTSSYLEGEHNALGAFGYNRDGKRGKVQIVIGLLADSSGEPLAVRAFAGNTADPSTAAAQIEILTKQFSIEDVSSRSFSSGHNFLVT